MVAVILTLAAVFLGCLVATAQQNEADLAKLEKVRQSFQGYLQKKDYDSVAVVLREYASDDSFIPQGAYDIISEILPYRELAPLVEEFATTAISRNSLAGLSQLDPRMGNLVKLDGLYLELFSQRAWARWKMDRKEEAWQDMKKVVQYRDAHSTPSEYGVLRLSSVDLLRLGIIATAIGQPDYGWGKIAEGVLQDAAVLDADSDYSLVLNNIVRKRFGDHADLTSVVKQLQDAATVPLPSMDLVGLNGQPIKLDGNREKPLVLIFFSPVCGSCQQELAAIRPLYQEAADQRAQFVLVLNRPELQAQAERLLRKHGLESATVATIQSGSAYDLIPGEPTTWLVDRQGRIVNRHIGFRQGDEVKYREELAALYAHAQ